MKLAIMQPYFLPYLGYWQLMSIVDKYVIYDDVTFIKSGWVNRNNMLLNNKKHLFTINMDHASSFQLINNLNIKGDTSKLEKTIEHAYRKAPQFYTVFPLIVSILKYEDKNLAKFLINSIKTIATYCSIFPEFIISSTIEKNNELHGAEKVLHICEILKASTYINAIGGRDLYSVDAFKSKGIDLTFIQTKFETYPQSNNTFIPGLSILDILMFNSKKEISYLLNTYELIC